jgi:hypothetical protein
MGKIGRFVTDPRVGTSCQIQLETILLSHDLGGFGGGSAPVPEIRLRGPAPGLVLLRCDLERDRSMLTRLVPGEPAPSARATPFGAFVEYLKGCGSLSKVRTRRGRLEPSALHPAAQPRP